MMLSGNGGNSIMMLPSLRRVCISRRQGDDTKQQLPVNNRQQVLSMKRILEGYLPC